jgi:hypothetical protein
MVVNFRARGISRDTRKLTRTPILINKKNQPITKKFKHMEVEMIKQIQAWLPSKRFLSALYKHYLL